MPAVHPQPRTLVARPPIVEVAGTVVIMTAFALLAIVALTAAASSSYGLTLVPLAVIGGGALLLVEVLVTRHVQRRRR